MATLTLQPPRGRCMAWISRALPGLQAGLGQAQNTFELVSNAAQTLEKRWQEPED